MSKFSDSPQKICDFSKLAVLVLLVPSILLPFSYGGTWIMLNCGPGQEPYYAGIVFGGMALAALLLPINFIFSIFILLRDASRGWYLKGFIPALVGLIITCFILCKFLLPSLAIAQNRATLITCQEQMSQINAYLKAYAGAYNGRYPTPDKWCDLLREKVKIEERLLKWHPGGDEEACYYAINPDARPDSPEDVVLLFEAEPGWNRCGGRQFLTIENHINNGCNILFCDGKVYFVSKKHFDELRWK